MITYTSTPTIQREFRNQEDALKALFIGDGRFPIFAARDFEINGKVAYKKRDFLSSLTNMTYAAKAYIWLSHKPEFFVKNLLNAIFSYEWAAEGARELNFTAMEYLCRATVIDLLQECLEIEDSDYRLFANSQTKRDGILQSQYKALSQLERSLKENRHSIPKIVFERVPNPVSNLFNPEKDLKVKDSS
jgi:hypothetical protein